MICTYSKQAEPWTKFIWLNFAYFCMDWISGALEQNILHWICYALAQLMLIQWRLHPELMNAWSFITKENLQKWVYKSFAMQENETLDLSCKNLKWFNFIMNIMTFLTNLNVKLSKLLVLLSPNTKVINENKSFEFDIEIKY